MTERHDRKIMSGFAAFAAAGLLMAGAQTADAARINNLTVVGDNLASDNDAERLAVDNNQDGILDVGDVVEGVLDIATLNSTGANVGGMTGNSEWSGVFRLEVTGKIQDGPNDFRFTFGPDSNWTMADDVLGTSDNSTNAMALMWDDTTPDTDFSTDLATAMTTSSNGDFYWALGFDDPSQASRVEDDAIVSDNGEGWVGRGDEEFTAAAGVSPGTSIGSANFALNRVDDTGLANDSTKPLIEQELGVVLASILGASPEDLVEIIGSSNVRGALSSTANAGFDADSDTSFAFVTVPSPSAATAGLALLGLVAFRRRRASAA